MPNAYLQGILQQTDLAAQIVNDISVIAINWFSNRCPLVTRVPRVPVGSTTFNIVSRNYRPRTTTLGAAVADGTTTSITLADASPYMVGDVLELATGERVRITADPPANNVITVTRGVEGTTGAAQTNGTAVTLVGNARPEGTVDATAPGLKPVNVPQYCQTFLHPVQVSGSAQASTGFQTEPGVRTPFDQYKMDALQNLMDDMEYSSYYGLGQAPASGGPVMQKGLKALITSGNVTTTPTNAGAYKSTDFVRDTFEKARTGGGDPDVLLLSTNFMTGLATWGHAAQRLDAGVNIFGTPINAFQVPFLGGAVVIEAPLLKPYTAVCLTSAEVRMRMKRNEFWNPRGVRGDAVEGDWIAEGAVEIDNPSHHAWVQGVTAFSAP